MAAHARARPCYPAPRGGLWKTTGTARDSGSSTYWYPSDALHAARVSASSARLASPPCSSSAGRSVPAAAPPQPGRWPAVRNAPGGGCPLCRRAPRSPTTALPARWSRRGRSGGAGRLAASSRGWWPRLFRARLWRRSRSSRATVTAASGAGRTPPRSSRDCSAESGVSRCLPSSTGRGRYGLSEDCLARRGGRMCATPSRLRRHPRPWL